MCTGSHLVMSSKLSCYLYFICIDVLFHIDTETSTKESITTYMESKCTKGKTSKRIAIPEQAWESNNQ